MPSSCCAYNCTSTRRKNRNLSFHRLPTRDPALMAAWVQAIGREKWTPKKHSLLCCKHFEDKCFYDANGRRKLLNQAIPTLFSVPEHLQKHYEGKEHGSPQVCDVKGRCKLWNVGLPAFLSVSDNLQTFPAENGYNEKQQRSQTCEASHNNGINKVTDQALPTIFGVPDRMQTVSAKTNYNEKDENSSQLYEIIVSVSLTDCTNHVAKTSQPDHVYSLPSPQKLKKQLDSSIEKCLLLKKKQKIYEQQVRRQKEKLQKMENIIQGLKSRMYAKLWDNSEED